MSSTGQNSSRLRDQAAYFLRSLRFYADPRRNCCPNCGSTSLHSVHRKYLVTCLKRCQDCRLLFRTPTDPPAFTEDFYQQDYTDGITTDCPDPQTLKQYLAAGFKGTAKDFSPRIRLLQALGAKPGMRVVDYGASWGYEPWQLQQAGFQVAGFEISRPRARYAREKLGVQVVDQTDQLTGPVDVFFSCHVLEHIPHLQPIFDLARHLLRPGGLFVALTPNGAAQAMQRDPASYHRAWGGVHPLQIDPEFYLHAFPDCPKLLASHPYSLDQLAAWNHTDSITLALDGPELLFTAVV